ncbi:MAG: GNAT family N-acetyltransferase [Alphaproteobacteria bacterium]|nr:GNAT family N-acetyltransferase [Alphaproteobacteria bacterium]
MTLPPRPPVEIARLAGRTVALERVDLARHLDGLWESVGRHRHLWAATPPEPFADRDAFGVFLRERSARPDQVLYAVVTEDGCAGLFLVVSISPQMGTAELGLVYGAGLQRSTAGTETVVLALRHLFEDLGYRRIEWRCNSDNAASLAAAKRYGFTLEGVLRQHRWIKGANCDTAVHAIIDRDWPAIAARLADWLDPGNFDEGGRQRRPLLEAQP